jgi:hypothetical protein
MKFDDEPCEWEISDFEWLMDKFESQNVAVLVFEAWANCVTCAPIYVGDNLGRVWMDFINWAVLYRGGRWDCRDYTYEGSGPIYLQRKGLALIGTDGEIAAVRHVNSGLFVPR